MTKRARARGELAHLVLSEIHAAPWFNARLRLDASEDARLRDSLDEDGQQTPIIVSPLAESRALLDPRSSAAAAQFVSPASWELLRAARARWFLVAGFRRFRSLRELRVEEAEGRIIHPATLADLLVLNLSENTARRALAPVDLARRCRILRTFGLPVAAIATRLSLSAVYVFQLVAASSNLCPEALRAWESPYPPSFDLIREWSSLAHEEQRRRLNEWRGSGSPAGERCDGSGCSRAKYHLGECGPRTRIASRPGSRARRRALEATRKALRRGPSEVLDPRFAAGVAHALEWCAGVVRDLRLRP